MKSIALYICLMQAMAVCTRGADTNSSTNWVSEAEFSSNIISNSLLSKASSNLALIFRNEEGGTPTVFWSDKPICFGLISTTNVNYNIYMLNPEYGYRISATSESGTALESTKGGDVYGRKFSAVKGYDRSQLDGKSGRKLPYWTTAVPKFSGLPRRLPAPETMFKFSKPGKYTMWIEMQVWCSPFGAGNEQDIYLVKFPPVALQIIKRDMD